MLSKFIIENIHQLKALKSYLLLNVIIFINIPLTVSNIINL